MERFGDIVRANVWWKGAPENPLEVYWPFGNLRKTEMAIIVGDCVPEIKELLCLVAVENHSKGVRVRVGSCSNYGNHLVQRQLKAYQELFGSRPESETDPDTLAWLIKDDYLSDGADSLRIVANIDRIASMAEMSVLEVLLKIQENCIASDSVAIVSIGSNQQLPENIASVVNIEKVGNRAIQCRAEDEVTFIRNMRCGPYIGKTDQLLSKTPPVGRTWSLHSDIVAKLWDELEPFLMENMPFVWHRMANEHIKRVVSVAIVHCECSHLYPVIDDDGISFVAECKVWFDFSQNFYRPDQHANIRGFISGHARDSTISIDSIHTLLTNPIQTFVRI